MLDRSRPGRFRTAVASAIVMLSVASVACSAPTPARDDLSDAFTASGLPPDVARCAAEALVTELSQEELDVLVERGNGGVPIDDPDRDDDAADRLRAALADCQELLPTTTLAPAEPSVPPTGIVEPEPTPSTDDGPALEPGPSSSSTTTP